MSSGCLPCIKCAGGKRKLLPHLLPHVAKKIGMYAEPFVGGGALYFAIWKRCKEAVLIDQNKDLIVFYRQLRDNPKELMTLARCWVVAEDTYYRVRDLDAKRMPDAERAARFLYLNKTCFNGLWRVNARGEFNVPWGKWKEGKPPLVVDEDALMACSKALQKARLICADFTVAARHEPDFVYCDSPYDPVSESSDFTRYAKKDFTWKDQKRLAEWASAWRDHETKHGRIRIMLSNADTKRIRKLYKRQAPDISRPWKIEEVMAARAINSDTARRGKVKELIIT